MQCPKCGTDNVSHASYCAACGTQISDADQIVIKDYAGFWRRFAAVVIDSILLTVLGGVGGAVIGAVVGFAVGFSGRDAVSYTLAITVLGYIFGTVLNWLYFTLMESSEKQATLGKMAL